MAYDDDDDAALAWSAPRVTFDVRWGAEIT